MISKTFKTMGLATMLALPISAFATNGYLLHGYGKNKGMGGAGIAHPQDALIGATNPAGSAWIGTRFDGTAELFFPKRGYSISNEDGFGVDADFGDAFESIGLINGPNDKTSVKSEKDIFLIPAMGFVWQYTDKVALGAAMYGAGLGSEYNRDDTREIFKDNDLIHELAGSNELNGTFFAGSTGVDLLLILTNFHAAYKVTDKFSVGGGLNLAMESFKAKGLAPFNFVSSGNIPDGERSYTFGWGLNVGVQAEVIPGLTLAAAYYSKIKLVHDKYDGLFANEGDFSLPPRINIGMSIELNKNHRVNFDMQKITWSSVASSGNKFSQLVNFDFTTTQEISFQNNFLLNPVGSADGAGFGFEDSLVYKFGYEFSLDSMPSWTWRMGYSYQSQIIPSNATLFPILAPATIQHHYTIGFTKEFDNGYEFTFNGMYTGKEEVTGTGLSEGIDIYLEELTAEFAIGIKW